MSSISDFLEKELLDHAFGVASWTPPTNVYLSLHTTPGPTDAGTANEITGVGNYARQLITFGAATGTVATISNTVAVEFGPVTGTNFGDIVSVAVFDALTVGNMLAWTAITSATVNIGDTLTFNIGDIDITLD